MVKNRNRRQVPPSSFHTAAAEEQKEKKRPHQQASEKAKVRERIEDIFVRVKKKRPPAHRSNAIKNNDVIICDCHFCKKEGLAWCWLAGVPDSFVPYDGTCTVS